MAQGDGARYAESKKKLKWDANTLNFACTSVPAHQHSYILRSLVHIQWPVERFADTRKTNNNLTWAPMANSHYSKPASTTCSARPASWVAQLVTMLACARMSISATVSVTAPTLSAPSHLMPLLQLPMAAASVQVLLLVLEVELEVSAITLQAQRQTLTVSLTDGVSTTTATTLTTVATGTTTTTAATGTGTGGVRDSLEQRLEHG
jgi:hypothetical protein